MIALDDYLVAQITFYLPSPLDTPLRATCARLRAIIKPPTKRSPNELLTNGAKIGSEDLCIFARSCGANNYYEMLCVGALHNHRAICEFAREWLRECNEGVSYFAMINHAARGGHRAICELAEKWARENNEDPDYDWMLAGAAEGGHRAICELARARLMGSATPLYNLMLASAAGGGHRAICELAREWILDARQSVDYNCALINAAHGGHREICELARKWILDSGQCVNYIRMLESAAARHNAICELVREWILSDDGNYDTIRNAAEISDNYYVRDLVREWEGLPKNQWWSCTLL